MRNRGYKGIAILAIAGFGIWLGAEEARAGAALPEGITLEGIELSGKTADEAIKAIDEHLEKNRTRILDIDFNGKTVSTSVSELGYHCTNEQEIEEAVQKYTEGDLIKRYKDSVDLSIAPVELKLQEGIDSELLDEFIQENADGLGKKAQNATIKRENGKFVITDSVDGISVNQEATKEAIEQALSSSTEQRTEVKAEVEVGRPKITREDLEHIKDVLGTFTTDYSSSSSARATNIVVGSKKLDGKLLMPGETLSGYEHMHPFTTDNGYEIAHAFENGQVVDSVGGGACQIATTLYNAALRAEVDITQRQNHSMTVSYVQPSADAAIAGTYKDIKITNNQDRPIYVESYTSGRKVTFTIWGEETRPSNRSLEFTSEVLSSTQAGVTYKDDPTLPQGQTVKESSGHNGRKSKLWKIVKVDGVEQNRELVSTDTYRVSNSIVRRGTGAPQPVPVEPTGIAEPTQDLIIPSDDGQKTDPTQAPTEITATEPATVEQNPPTEAIVPAPQGGLDDGSGGGPGVN